MCPKGANKSLFSTTFFSYCQKIKTKLSLNHNIVPLNKRWKFPQIFPPITFPTQLLLGLPCLSFLVFLRFIQFSLSHIFTLYCPILFQYLYFKYKSYKMYRLPLTIYVNKIWQAKSQKHGSLGALRSHASTVKLQFGLRILTLFLVGA